MHGRKIGKKEGRKKSKRMFDIAGGTVEHSMDVFDVPGNSLCFPARYLSIVTKVYFFFSSTRGFPGATEYICM